MHKFVMLILGVLVASPGFGEPVDVYILSGQSNMVGSPTIDTLTPEQRAPIAQAHFWNGSAFETYVPGKTLTSAKPQRFGPELAFARHCEGASPENSIYLIKFAVGGRPLHAGWDHAKWMGEAPGPNRETFYPGEKPGDPNVGKLYKRLLQRVLPALAHLKEKNIDYRVRGVLWMQGEADAKNPVAAAAYAKSLKQWHQRLLEDVGAEPCPLVFGQVLPYTPPAERFTDRDTLRQSQANLDRDSGHEDAYEWARMVPTDGMGLMKDTVHYDAEGQLALGKAFAEAMAAMLKSRG